MHGVGPPWTAHRCSVDPAVSSLGSRYGDGGKRAAGHETRPTFTSPLHIMAAAASGHDYAV